MVSKKVVLRFPRRLVNKPIIYRLVKDYNLQFNILKANVTPEEEGLMVLEISGRKDDFAKGMSYLEEMGLKIQPLAQDVGRNEERCTDCGVCIPFCPTGALHIDRHTFKVSFYEDKCIACEFCVKVCPARAMEVHF